MRVEINGIDCDIRDEADQGRLVARVYGYYYGGHEHIPYALAFRMAASDDLLMICKDALECLQMLDVRSMLQTRLKTAIEQAKTWPQ